MPSREVYQCRIALGHCGTCGRAPTMPDDRYCTRCHTHYPVTFVQVVMDADQGTRCSHPGPLVGHCDTWHALTALPFDCPTCGVRLFEEVSHGVE